MAVISEVCLHMTGFFNYLDYDAEDIIIFNDAHTGVVMVSRWRWEGVRGGSKRVGKGRNWLGRGIWLGCHSAAVQAGREMVGGDKDYDFCRSRLPAC